MIRATLALFGLEIVYVCAWGAGQYRYSAIDYAMTRPVHEKMSVAPPWAKMRLRGLPRAPSTPSTLTLSGPSSLRVGDWLATTESHRGARKHVQIVGFTGSHAYHVRAEDWVDVLIAMARSWF